MRPAVGRVPPLGRSEAVAPLEPRLRVDYALSSQVAWFAGVGRYHQAPSAPDLSAVFGNPELGLSSATRASVGERIRLEALEVELAGFYKWLAELPVCSPSRSPETARVLVPTGEGKVYGKRLEGLRVDWFATAAGLAVDGNEVEEDVEAAPFVTNEFRAPEAPAVVDVWAVVHDSRGGSVVLHRQLAVR